MNLDPDPDPGLCCHFWKRNILSVKSLNGGFFFNLTLFVSNLSILFSPVWIRIRTRNTDLEAQSSWIWIQFGSVYTTLLSSFVNKWTRNQIFLLATTFSLFFKTKFSSVHCCTIFRLGNHAPHPSTLLVLLTRTHQMDWYIYYIYKTDTYHPLMHTDPINARPLPEPLIKLYTASINICFLLSRLCC